MSAPKHTPGPWICVSELQKGGIARIMPGYRQRHCIATVPTGKDVDAKEADARLIAAAPTMLHALRVASHTISMDIKAAELTRDGPDDDIINTAIADYQKDLDLINNAITLATGEQA